MKVPLRWLLAVVAVVGVAVVLWPRHHGPYAPGPSSPRLVVLEGWEEGGPLGQVQGILSVNDRGCLTLGGDVVVGQDGSRVLPRGGQVVFRGAAAVDIGSHIQGAGGQLGTLKDIRERSLDADFVQALAGCLRGHPDGEAVQYWLPSD